MYGNVSNAKRLLHSIDDVCLKNHHLPYIFPFLDIIEKIKDYFYKGFSYRLIHYLIQRNHNCDIR